MMMTEMKYSENQWLTERCLLCDSINHVFISHPSPDGWICWNCNSKWWLDNFSPTLYTMVHGREADLDDDEVILLQGYCDRA